MTGRNEDPNTPKSPTRTGRLLDQMDIPGRPLRRSNTMSKQQIAFENSPRIQAGKLAVSTGLAVYGGYKVRKLLRSMS